MRWYIPHASASAMSDSSISSDGKSPVPVSAIVRSCVSTSLGSEAICGIDFTTSGCS